MDEDDCVKLAGIFTFLFLIALCSANVIFCALRESLAMGSCSYSCTIDHPTGNRLASLISLFLFLSFFATDVKLAGRSSILDLEICSSHSCMAKEISMSKSNWSQLPFPFMSCSSGLYFFAGGSMFLSIWVYLVSKFLLNIKFNASSGSFPPRILEKYVF